MKNKSIKIISVGNDSDNLISLRALIMEAFPLAEVMVADNLDKCLKLVSSEKRDIIFFDSAMLNEDCYKLCKKLKKDKTFCDIPLVFLTSANEDQNSLDTALKCGADAFIKKPIDKIYLIAQIRSMMKIRTANIERARVTHLVKEKRTELLKAQIKIKKLNETLSEEIILQDEIFQDAILESIPGYLYVYDEDGKLIKWNKNHESMTGYSAKELSEMNLSDWYEGEDYVRVAAAAAEVFRTGYGEVEADLLLKDGKKLRVRSNGVRFVVGGKTYFTGIGTDITNQNRIAAELIEAKEYFEIVFNTSPDAAIVTRLSDGVIVNINDGFIKISGFTRDESIGKTSLELHLYADINERQKFFEIIKEKSVCTDQEVIYRSKDGIFITGLVSAKSVVLKGVEYLVTYIHDISERKLMEETIRESETLYRTFIDASSDMVYLKDEQFNHLIVNKSMADFFSKTKENIFGKSDFELMPRPFAEICRKNDIEALSCPQGTVHIFEEATDNNIYETIKFPVKLQNDKTGVGGFIRDITKRKRAEENLYYMSYHDHLTGLYNRRFFEEELLRLDKEENLPLSIIMCDINGLKLINDSFGSLLGDKILKRTAELIKKVCSSDDIIARFGGDEFIIILLKTDILQTEQLVNRFNIAASKEIINPVVLSVSYGYETKSKSDQKIEDILSQAENNLYGHKLYESASMRNKTIGIIMNMLFEKSNREERHSKRVSCICEVIATKMQISKDNISQIKTAGLIHDIGKIGIDEKILNKSHALDIDEWEKIKRHPEAGWRILSAASEFSELAGFVLEHHERWDGKGYPKGLKGEEISLQARIIAVADAYDAMTNERSYRQAISQEETIIEIQRSSGTQFDPKIVKVFMGIINELNSIKDDSF